MQTVIKLKYVFCQISFISPQIILRLVSHFQLNWNFMVYLMILKCSIVYPSWKSWCVCVNLLVDHLHIWLPIFSFVRCISVHLTKVWRQLPENLWTPPCLFQCCACLTGCVNVARFSWINTCHQSTCVLFWCFTLVASPRTSHHLNCL